MVEEKPVWVLLRYSYLLLIVHLCWDRKEKLHRGFHPHLPDNTHTHSDNTFASLNMTHNLPPTNQPRSGQPHCTKFSPPSRYKFPTEDLLLWRRAVKGCTVLWERAVTKIRLIRLTREMRQGEGGMIRAPKYLYCCCQQNRDSFRKKNSLKVLIGEKIRRIIKRGEPFKGIRGELIHVFLWNRAFGE